MNLWLLKPGHKIRTSEGAEAMVLDETEDGVWIRIKYLPVKDEDSIAGTEELVNENDIQALLGVAELDSWNRHTSVTLLSVQGTEGYPDTYEATTMAGVPYNVTISSTDEDSKEESLNRLLSSLRTFGFRGSVLVHDTTIPGMSDEYQVEV